MSKSVVHFLYDINLTLDLNKYLSIFSVLQLIALNF